MSLYSLDIFLASTLFGALVALAVRSAVLGAFLRVIDPPAGQIERATVTYRQEKGIR